MLVSSPSRKISLPKAPKEILGAFLFYKNPKIFFVVICFVLKHFYIFVPAKNRKCVSIVSKELRLLVKTTQTWNYARGLTHQTSGCSVFSG